MEHASPDGMTQSYTQSADFNCGQVTYGMVLYMTPGEGLQFNVSCRFTTKAQLFSELNNCLRLCNSAPTALGTERHLEGKCHNDYKVECIINALCSDKLRILKLDLPFKLRAIEHSNYIYVLLKDVIGLQLTSALALCLPFRMLDMVFMVASVKLL